VQQGQAAYIKGDALAVWPCNGLWDVGQDVFCAALFSKILFLFFILSVDATEKIDDFIWSAPTAVRGAEEAV
jgi:hypothetical protein